MIERKRSGAAGDSRLFMNEVSERVLDPDQETGLCIIRIRRKERTLWHLKKKPVTGMKDILPRRWRSAITSSD
jgi:hypothetical protein